MASLRVAYALVVAAAVLVPVWTAEAQQSTQPTRERISEWARRVDAALPRMRRTRVALPDASAEGGQLAAYATHDSLRKLVATYAGETGKATESYYVDRETLRLYVRTEARYDRPMSGTVVKSTVERMWFVEDSAVAWRDTLGRISTRGRAFSARRAEVRRAFNDVKRLAVRKKKR